MADTRGSGFCSQCGLARATEQQYCAGCGAPFASASAPSTSDGAGARRSRSAAVVMAAFMAVGAAVLWLGTRDSGSVSRAVPGRPSQGAGGAGALGGRQSVEFPEEITKFLEELQEAATQAPDDVEAWEKLARAHFRASQLNPSYAVQARQSLDHLMGLDADNLEGLRMSGNLAYSLNDFGSAQAYYEKYLAIEPGDPHVLTDLGSVLLFQNQRERAKQIYNDVLKTNPEFVQAHFNLAIALHAEGDSKGALERLKIARDYATQPEYRERIDEYIRSVESGAAHGEIAPAGVESNESSPLQARIGKLFTEHSIVGSKVTSIEWKDAGNATVYLEGFPMDKMPPVVRNKFKATMNEQIQEILKDNGAQSSILVRIVDKASNNVMDTLDGKEFVGAFDEAAYE